MKNDKKVSGIFTALLAVCLLSACGERSTPVPTDENLLLNGSFEDVAEGMPVGWELSAFRGLEDAVAATYGVTDTVSFDGQRSFYFTAAPETQRLYTLAQQVRVYGADRVRIRGAVRSVGVDRTSKEQSTQANFALTFFDANNERFESIRFADVRTKRIFGTSDGWVEIDRVYRPPLGTEYVTVHCVLGMPGELYFDNVSLEVVGGAPWNEAETADFTHYWLEKPYPDGARELQQEIYESYAVRLGIPPENRAHVYYYLYPDTATFLEMTGRRSGHVHVDYARQQIHSLNPVDEHEIVHMLTQPYGTLPRILSEGTAFYMMNRFNEKPILPLAQDLLIKGELLSIEQVLDPSAIRRYGARVLLPTGAAFVAFLIEIGGTSKFLDLHGATTGDMAYPGFAVAFENIYGQSLADIEQAWRRVLANADFSGGDTTEPRQ